MLQVPCAAHALDLILKDFCKEPFIADALKQCRAVVKWVRNHHLPLALFSSLSNLALLLPGDTRFGSHLICTQRYLAVRPALKLMVLKPEFRSWLARQPGAKRAAITTVVAIIEDNSLAKQLETIIAALSPVMQVLRLFDGARPVMGFVYHAMYELTRAVDAMTVSARVADASFKERLADIVRSRWDWMHSPLHAAAYALNPRYAHLITDICANAEVMRGLKQSVKKLAPNPAAAALALNEFSSLYKQQQGDFADEVTQAAAATESIAPHAFWDQHGTDCPNLRPIAMQILAQYPYASACERNWSDYTFVHTKRRNRLGVERAQDLVFAFSNGRMLEEQAALREDRYSWIGPEDQDTAGLADADSGAESDCGAAIFGDKGASDNEVDLRVLDSDIDDMFEDCTAESDGE